MDTEEGERSTHAGTWAASLGFAGDLRTWRRRRERERQHYLDRVVPEGSRAADPGPPLLRLATAAVVGEEHRALHAICGEEVEGGTLGLRSHRRCGGEGEAPPL